VYTMEGKGKSIRNRASAGVGGVGGNYGELESRTYEDRRMDKKGEKYSSRPRVLVFRSSCSPECGGGTSRMKKRQKLRHRGERRIGKKKIVQWQKGGGCLYNDGRCAILLAIQGFRLKRALVRAGGG